MSKVVSIVALSIGIFASLFAVSNAYAQGVSLKMAPVDPGQLWYRFETIPEENKARGERLAALFRGAGCGDQVDEKVRGSKLPNIVCTLPGETDEFIIIGAHYDKTEAGRGAVDNWSGASMLASLYEGLAEHDRHYSYRFVGFSDEEKGLVGSRSHARMFGKKSTEKPVAMINIDTIGSSMTTAWLSRADERLARALLTIADAMKLPFGFVNVEQVGETDSEPFRKKGIPVITIHSLTQELMPVLHTEADTPDVVDREQLHESYRLVLAYLTYLDQVWRPEEPSDSF